MPRFLVLQGALTTFRRPAFWIFLASGPIIYFTDDFFYWLNETYFYLVILFLILYYLVLIAFFLIKLLKGKQFHRLIFLNLLFFTIVLASNIPDYISGLGFRWYIHLESKYVKDHCHPVHFNQDGKTYRLGLCDLKIDKDGQSNFTFLYDTSGDAAMDIDTQTKSGRRDRKEWVSAIRQIFNDDPNETFEIADFWVYHIDGDFYFVNFDDADAEGFIREYGLPPENPKNPYPSIFYPEPDQKK